MGKKQLIVMAILCFTLNACASYKPIIDTKGQTGAYSESRANELTDDLQSCKTLAEENTNTLVETMKVGYNVWWRASSLYLADKLEYNYPKIVRNCLQGRNHKVVN